MSDCFFFPSKKKKHASNNYFVNDDSSRVTKSLKYNYNIDKGSRIY